jgi:hypothetical protein
MNLFQGARATTGTSEKGVVAATVALLPGRPGTERTNPGHGEPRQKALPARGPPQ